MRINLKVTSKRHRNREFTFEGHDHFIVGRSPLAHLRLTSKDKSISRIHFMMEINPPHCRLMDLHSRNGTFVNGKKVKSVALADGDQIKVGKTTLRVEVHADDKRVAAEAATPCEPLAGQPPKAPPLTTAVSDYGTLHPPRFAVSSPQPPVRPAPDVTRCRACAEPIAGDEKPPPKESFPQHLGPICRGCQEETRRQPQPIPGYVVVRKLGEGGMGAVYLVLRKAGGAAAALKLITRVASADPGALARFLREAAILHELRHPNIVAFREMGSVDGRPYFVMDLVRGCDAARLVKTEGRMAIARAAGLTCQLLDALDYAHSKEYVHRDINPPNVIVERKDGRETVKLADFGLARYYQASQLSGLTLKGSLGGSVGFMAPEQITNFREVKPAGDLYAVGATLYYLLTKQHVYNFPHDVEGQVLMVLQGAAVPVQSRRPDTPDGLAALIHRALARKVEDRFTDVREMRKALAAFCEPVPAAPLGARVNGSGAGL
jgi:serine/threonine-protein kinase